MVMMVMVVVVMVMVMVMVMMMGWNDAWCGLAFSTPWVGGCTQWGWW